VTFTASAAVFANTAGSGAVGDVIRVGGGVAVVTSYISTTQVIANITQPISATVPNDPNNLPIPQISGNWNIATPTTIVTGLNHLNGMSVTGLADGSVIPATTVVNGSITLPNPASAITIGLGFTAQLQAMYLNPEGQQTTVQGKRKNITSISARFENMRGLQLGANMPDASTQPNGQQPAWTNMVEVKQRDITNFASNPIALQTSDAFVNVNGGWSEYGQMAAQITDPVPCTLLSMTAFFTVGDSASQ